MSWPEWYLTAACRGTTNPELFFSKGQDNIAAARKVCFRCPARDDCAELALAEGLEGIWGGLTDHQRRMIRRNQAAPRECAFDGCDDLLPLTATKTMQYCEYHRSYYHRQVAS